MDISSVENGFVKEEKYFAQEKYYFKKEKARKSKSLCSISSSSPHFLLLLDPGTPTHRIKQAFIDAVHCSVVIGKKEGGSQLLGLSSFVPAPPTVDDWRVS